MSHDATRRRALKSLAVLGASSLAPSIAFGQSKAIAATTYPGAWEEAHRSILVSAFRKQTGASVNLVASLAVDTVSKLIASKANPAYDVIILDTPPVSEYADAQCVAFRAGDVMLVSRRDQTRVDDTERAVKELSDASARIVGTLMNSY